MSDMAWLVGEVDRLRAEVERLRAGAAAAAALLDCGETSTTNGCCSGCDGTGYSGDEATGGQCWDCRATGHPHGPVAVEDLPDFIAALRAVVHASGAVSS